MDVLVEEHVVTLEAGVVIGQAAESRRALDAYTHDRASTSVVVRVNDKVVDTADRGTLTTQGCATAPVRALRRVPSVTHRAARD